MIKSLTIATNIPILYETKQRTSQWQKRHQRR